MKALTLLFLKLFCSTTKRSLSNFIPTLYPESLRLCKKAVYYGLNLEVNTPFDFQLRTLPVLLSFLTLMYQVLNDKQTYFQNYHHQK